ncbi:hypothetical protein GE061_003940 [Apolygus lucorum]|uniref:Uncharacterized protein n=1 Tax=Apolygus lucorum TaxID=248454 RepID=A0A8S9WZA7_APOLU|nr:hypothetical protein GE061_003940 [Apolygus lucorum]
MIALSQDFKPGDRAFVWLEARGHERRAPPSAPIKRTTNRNYDLITMDNFVGVLRINASACEAKIQSYKDEHGSKYPFNDLGKALSDDESTELLIYLAKSYMKDYKSTHCTPLPVALFDDLARAL